MGTARLAIVLLMEFHVECTTHHVWPPLGARDMSLFVKHVFVQRSFGVVTISEHSVHNCTDDVLKIQKMMHFGLRYEHIMILWYYDHDIVKCDYYNVRVL